MDSVPQTLRVETGSYDEAADLLRALSMRGVSGRVAVAVDVEIEQSDRGGSPLEAVVALEGWLLDRARASIPVRLDDRRYDLRPRAPRDGSPVAVARPMVDQ
jgi:hypothetical protein